MKYHGTSVTLRCKQIRHFLEWGWSSVMKSEKGFGIIQVILVMGVIALVAMGVVQTSQMMSQTSNIAKAQTGRDSLVNGILSMLTEESLCTRQLNIPANNFPNAQNILFSSTAANYPAVPTCLAGVGGCPPVSSQAGAQYYARQNLSFQLNNTSTPSTPTVLGGIQNAINPVYYGQFNAYVGAVYFTTDLRPTTLTTPNSFPNELGSGALNGATVYKGALWINTARPSTSNSTGTQPTFSTMADVLITSNLSIWVKNNTVVGCGIVKTPEQVCVDDIGGTYSLATTPNCTNVKSPCAGNPNYANNGNGYYYVGVDAKGNALCMPSPASCQLANQTVVSDGKGGWTCQSMPL
jgi:hypothetical protein